MTVKRASVKGDPVKVQSRDRKGRATTVWQLKWRLTHADGTTTERTRRFAGRGLAEQYARQLQWASDGVLVDGRLWVWDADGEPVPDRPDVIVEAVGPTLLEVVLRWRAATWKNGSPEGRRAAATVARRLVAVTSSGERPPAAVEAMLAQLFAGAEPPTVWDDARHDGRMWRGDELQLAWLWLRQSSLPAAHLTRDHVRSVLRALAAGRAASTEQRRWADLRSILKWLERERLVTEGLTAHMEVRSAGIPKLADLDAIPTVDEMWQLAWAMLWVQDGRWAPVPLVMGAGGLRIGEVAGLQRRHVVEDAATGGLWLRVRRSTGTVAARWTDDGRRTHTRGTKAKGPEGDQDGRSTFLPPREAGVLRAHMARFVGQSPDALVFCRADGGPLELGHFQRDVWGPVRDVVFAGNDRVGDVGRHAFRHLATVRWLRAGVPLRVAARWGGWRDVATMVRWYDATMPGDDAAAAGLLS